MYMQIENGKIITHFVRHDIFMKKHKKHILECKVIMERNIYMTYMPYYNELFSDFIEDQLYTSRMLYENLKIRNNIINILPIDSAHVN